MSGIVPLGLVSPGIVPLGQVSSGIVPLRLVMAATTAATATVRSSTTTALLLLGRPTSIALMQQVKSPVLVFGIIEISLRHLACTTKCRIASQARPVQDMDKVQAVGLGKKQHLMPM